MSAEINNRKVAIIGCGFVGSSSAFALMQSGLFSEIVLVDVNKDKAEGEAMDISHGVPFVDDQVDVHAGNYDDVVDAGIIVVTAGAAQKPGETRLDLINKNVKIFKSIIPEIAKRNYKGILLIVANPVDILTRVAMEISGLPENRVFGSGTVLDSARLKNELGKHLNVDARSVHSFIIGEHGDSEIAVFSSANVSGVPLSRFCELRGHFDHQTAMREIADDVRNSAYEIIEKKHATYYGIAMSVVRICRAIVTDSHSVLPVSTVVRGRYGISETVMSIPSVVGINGVETLVPITLSEGEEKLLQDSAETLNKVWDGLDLD